MEINEEFIKRAEELQKLDVFKLMTIEATNLKDCYVLTPRRFGDDRGFFEQVDMPVLKVLGLYEEPKLKNSRSNKTNHIFNQLKAQYSYSKYSKPKNYNFRKH